MRLRVLDLIVCPGCHGPLELQASLRDGDEVLEGRLTCGDCGAYPISGGIPRLLPLAGEVPTLVEQTVDRFGRQWNDFDDATAHYYQRQFLGWIAPNTPEVFRGQVVLEGGCGKGRHSALVSSFGARDVLAVDLGSAVQAAWRNTRALPNVHVIQADLNHLPIADGTVDIAFSIGVLHHTPSPEQAFRSLAKSVRPGGRVIAWVYGRENNGWIVRFVNPARQRLTSKLPHRWLYHLARIPAAIVYATSHGLYGSVDPKSPLGARLVYGPYMRQLSEFPFNEIHSIVHDHLTPPIAHYIPRSEFLRWFEDARLENVHVRWHNENSWSGTAFAPTLATRLGERDAVEASSARRARATTCAEIQAEAGTTPTALARAPGPR